MSPIKFFVAFLLVSLSLIGQERKVYDFSLDQSILNVKNDPILDFTNLNIKENLEAVHVSIYNLNDIVDNRFYINTRYFDKPISKFALETYTYDEIFFRSIRPKPIIFEEFRRFDYFNRLME